MRVVATLLYGAGLRLLEALRLRVKDVDLERRDITVRSGKSDRDRVTMLAEPALAALRRQLERVRTGHARDLARAAGWVELPRAAGRKSPGAAAIRVAASASRHSNNTASCVNHTPADRYPHLDRRRGEVATCASYPPCGALDTGPSMARITWMLRELAGVWPAEVGRPPGVQPRYREQPTVS